MSKTKGNRFSNKARKAATKPETEEIEAPAAKATTKPERVDTKGPHKAAAIAKARAAFKALGLTAPAFFDTIEAGKATESDYTALKVQTDALKVAVNSLGCHFQPAKEAKAKA